MALRRLCKSAGSTEDHECPAVYEAEDQSLMIAQGKILDPSTMAGLQDLAGDETAVAIPAETVLRAAGLYLAERGRPAVLAEVESYLLGVLA